MTSIFRFLKTVLRGEAARMDELRRQGLAIDVAGVGPEDQVIEIGLGFGPELWKVRSGYVIDPARAVIEGGQIILDGGKPLTDRRRLDFLREGIAEVRFKT